MNQGSETRDVAGVGHEEQGQATGSEHRGKEGHRAMNRQRRRHAERASEFDEGPFDLTVSEVLDRVASEVRSRPLPAVAVAFGVGAIIGQAFTSKLARLALFAAASYATKELVGPRIAVALEEVEGDLRRRANERLT